MQHYTSLNINLKLYQSRYKNSRLGVRPPCKYYNRIQNCNFIECRSTPGLSPKYTFYIDARKFPFHTGLVNAIQSKIKTKVSLNRLTGLLEVYDTETGKLVAVQSTPDEDLLAARDARLVERLLPDGSSVLCEATIDPTLLAKFKYKEYSRYVVDLICEKIVQGGSVTKICNGAGGYPTYAEFCRWKRQDPEIQKQVDQARKDRAEALRDEIVEMADNLSERDGDEIKTKIDTYKYLASVDDKQKFGNQKSEAQVVQPIQILINTGITRE